MRFFVVTIKDNECKVRELRLTSELRLLAKTCPHIPTLKSQEPCTIIAFDKDGVTVCGASARPNLVPYLPQAIVKGERQPHFRVRFFTEPTETKLETFAYIHSPNLNPLKADMENTMAALTQWCLAVMLAALTQLAMNGKGEDADDLGTTD